MGHKVTISFDDGLYAKLICPDDDSCRPGNVCAECHRHTDDSETQACDACPRETDECWVKTWFDNCTADELLHGELTVEITPEWDGDHMLAHIGALRQED